MALSRIVSLKEILMVTGKLLIYRLGSCTRGKKCGSILHNLAMQRYISMFLAASFEWCNDEKKE